jgi:hypothetical protein
MSQVFEASPPVSRNLLAETWRLLREVEKSRSAIRSPNSVRLREEVIATLAAAESLVGRRPLGSDDSNRAAIASAMDAFLALARSPIELMPFPNGFISALGASQRLLTLLSASGECRQDLPYAPVQPVIRADGSTAWCCTHPTEHCS